MDEKMSGMGLIIVLLILFGLFGFGRGFGGFGNGFGWNGCGNGFNGWGWGGFAPYGCNATTNCQVEKQEIIDSARTQFLITDTARQTQEQNQALATALGNKIDFYEYQNLRDQLAAERNKNMVLENRIYSDNKFNALEAQISALGCEVSKLPRTAPVYTTGVSCNGYTYPGCCTPSCTPSLV